MRELLSEKSPRAGPYMVADRSAMPNLPHSAQFVGVAKDELFVNRPLLRMMPELTTMEHVHIDASMLVIYYCILHQGSVTPDTTERAGSRPTEDMMSHIYAQTASESLDMDLGREMHNKACSYAQILNLHSIDRTDSAPPEASPIVANDDRRLNMWNLIQIDLIYRLVQQETSALAFDFTKWHVNLPSLTFDPESSREEAVHTMTFLARSRVALILIDFYRVVDDGGQGGGVSSSIVGLCEQVEDVVKEWKILEWMESCKQADLEAYAISEAALICYTSILFMLIRQADSHRGSMDAQTPEAGDMITLRPDLSLPAARKVIEIIHHVLQVLRLPGPEILSSSFCFYRADVAYSHIANCLIDKHPAARSDDIKTLRNFADCVRDISRQERELLPLLGALEATCLVHNAVYDHIGFQSKGSKVPGVEGTDNLTGGISKEMAMSILEAVCSQGWLEFKLFSHMRMMRGQFQAALDVCYPELKEKLTYGTNSEFKHHPDAVISIALKTATQLVNMGVVAEDITIITPYLANVAALKFQLRDMTVKDGSPSVGDENPRRGVSIQTIDTHDVNDSAVVIVVLVINDTSRVPK
ncbi:hypothetical protein PspLS_09397 [Pyricularia sp. CBS 133598]|nr:hypothetical protein PspLS_09397 [Pyricularia sp. CBS 133598]